MVYLLIQWGKTKTFHLCFHFKYVYTKEEGDDYLYLKIALTKGTT